jgi:hypothetical protein
MDLRPGDSLADDQEPADTDLTPTPTVPTTRSESTRRVEPGATDATAGPQPCPESGIT